MNKVKKNLFIFLINIVFSLSAKDRCVNPEEDILKKATGIDFISMQPCNPNKIKLHVKHLHKKFCSRLKVSYYHKIDFDSNINKYVLKIFFFIPYAGSTEVKLSKDITPKDLNIWGISILDENNEYIHPDVVIKKEMDSENSFIFGEKKSKFVNLYEVKFSLNDLPKESYNIKLSKYHEHAIFPLHF